jgi:hypothetical protein
MVVGFANPCAVSIRISAHQLATETGRYMKPPLPVPERFCKNCKNKVEDEKHFIQLTEKCVFIKSFN